MMDSGSVRDEAAVRPDGVRQPTDRERARSADKWWETHGDYPWRVMGFRARGKRTHKTLIFCVDCCAAGRFLTARDAGVEEALCADCGGYLRQAANFLMLHEGVVGAYMAEARALSRCTVVARPVLYREGAGR